MKRRLQLLKKGKKNTKELNLLEFFQIKYKKMIGFRIIAISVSIIFLIVCFFIPNNYFSELQNILIGIFASSFVWGIVDLFNYVHEIHIECHKEFIELSKKCYKGCKEIRNIFRESASFENLEWVKVKDLFNKLSAEVIEQAHKSSILFLTKDFQDFYNYLTRASIKVEKYVDEYGNKITCTEKMEELYNILVFIDEEEYLMNDLNQKNTLLKESESHLRDIEINYEPLKLLDYPTYERRIPIFYEDFNHFENKYIKKGLIIEKIFYEKISNTQIMLNKLLLKNLFKKINI